MKNETIGETERRLGFFDASAPSEEDARTVITPRRSGRAVVSIVLAGGQGSRLAPLTVEQAKPAVAFGPQHRIIDFALSNLLNSGMDGIHVLVPVARRHTYEDTRAFSELVAGTLARTHPGLVTTEWVRRKRRGVLVDSNQNRQGATIASVYSVRPRQGAPVSAPLRWSELSEDIRPGDFTMEVVLDRIERHGDLYAPVLKLRQSLTQALAKVS